MEILRQSEGRLAMMVADSEEFIREGTSVVIWEGHDKGEKDLYVMVTSAHAQVRLPYYDTDADVLLGRTS